MIQLHSNKARGRRMATDIAITTRQWLGAALLGALVPVLPALAQSDAGKAAPAGNAAPAPVAPPPPTTGRIEAGVGAAHLNGADGDWRDVYVRGYVRPAPGTTINAELASQGHFNQRGTLGAVSILQDLSPDWFVMAGVSGGSAEFQYRLRGDVGIYRKWGATRQWVTGLTVMRGLGATTSIVTRCRASPLRITPPTAGSPRAGRCSIDRNPAPSVRRAPTGC
ncbi:YaiO family outer membrane beta-barrel protein [Ottowia pentelensis]|uniref:YaiO family outer membrane beta-barrel protein n=1 Tax=Ottowia pentelensis TaxID=511108 RepID=UPI003637E138